MNTKDLIETILDQAVPGDITLGELKNPAQRLDMWKQIPNVKPENVVVRFLQGDKELPDTMTIGEFRPLPDGQMNITIYPGGLGVEETEGV